MHSRFLSVVRRLTAGAAFAVSFFFVLFSGFQHKPEPDPEPDCAASVICPSEELVYEVTFFKFHLGEVRLKTFSSNRVDGRLEYHAAAYVDSYEGVPFVDLHTIEHTSMDSLYNSLGVKYFEKKNDGWLTERTIVTPGVNRLIVEKAHQKKIDSDPLPPIERDTLTLGDPSFQDGLSIFYFARANIRRNADVTVPTVVYGKKGKTRFSFGSKREYREIDAFPGRNIRVIPLEGKAEFQGIFGMTGDFRGWFTDDAAAIPVRAEVKVLIGSIDVELARWKRTGWNPPQ